MNTKSVVLTNYRKINHQQKNAFIICKQLNGTFLKSLKSKWSGPKSEKKIGLIGAWAEIIIFTSH